MTEAANIERQNRRQAEFVNDEQQRLLEIEDMRLVVKFGRRSAIPIKNARRSTRNSSTPGSTTKQKHNPDVIEVVFSRNSTPTTRVRGQGAISAVAALLTPTPPLLPRRLVNGGNAPEATSKPGPALTPADAVSRVLGLLHLCCGCHLEDHG